MRHTGVFSAVGWFRAGCMMLATFSLLISIASPQTPPGTTERTPTPVPRREPTATASPMPHVGRNPITDPWPKLDPSEMKAVQTLMDAAAAQTSEADKTAGRTAALDKLVEIMKKYCCNFDTMKNSKPSYDPDLKSDGGTAQEKGGRVRIGPKAFKNAPYLY